MFLNLFKVKKWSPGFLGLFTPQESSEPPNDHVGKDITMSGKNLINEDSGMFLISF